MREGGGDLSQSMVCPVRVGLDVGLYSNLAWKVNLMDRIYTAFFTFPPSNRTNILPTSSLMYDTTLLAGNIVPSSNGGRAHTNLVWCSKDILMSSRCSTK